MAITLPAKVEKKDVIVITVERKEIFAEIFLRGYRKMHKRGPVFNDPEKTWWSRLEEYAWYHLMPDHHYFSNDLVDVIKHLPIDEDEGWVFASMIASELLKRKNKETGEPDEFRI